jgi:DUF2892 family protein
MTKNLGNADRVLRIVGATAATCCAVLSPFPLGVRLGVFGGTALYLVLTALAGTCLGYRLIGKSTCPTAGQGA